MAYCIGIEGGINHMEKLTSKMILQGMRRLFGMPSGGDWYCQQKDALAATVVKYGLSNGFVGAWQIPDTQAMCFGVYENFNAFMLDVQTKEPGKRYGYEIIRADVPCRLFFDIEWVSEVFDLKHEFLGRFVNVLHQVFANRFGRPPVLRTTCDTRILKDGSKKNSYHLLEVSHVFENGHGKGSLMQLVVSDVLELLSAEDRKCVDKGVYTRNRPMRTPLCSKRESNSVGFRNISGDNSSLIMATFIHEREIPDNDPDGYYGFAISCPGAVESSTFFLKNPSEATQEKSIASHENGRKHARTGSKKNKEPSENLFTSVKEVETMLEKVGIQLCRIHVGKCVEYAEWMSVLFAVNNTMAGQGNNEVIKMLDAFSCIRSGYRGTFDVESKYSVIVPRGESESKITIETIKYFAREFPALTLASHPSTVEYDELRAAMDSVWEGDARKKIDNCRALRQNMLGLLMIHTDKQRTNWKWFAQLCSTLVGESESIYTENVKTHIIQEYEKTGIIIGPGDLAWVWNACESIFYRRAIVSYAREELLKKMDDTHTGISSSDASEKNLSSASTLSKSASMIVVSHQHQKNGRGGLKIAAQLLAQLSPTVLMKLLRRHDSTPSPLLQMLRLYLRDSDAGEQVSTAFEALLFDSNVDKWAMDTCTADEDAEDNMEEDQTIDICPGDSISNVSQSKSLESLSFSFAVEPGVKVNFDDDTTLDSFVSLYGVLILEKKWCTTKMSPYNMSEALVANLHNSVEWRCIIWWVCILTYYQKHIPAKIAALKAAEQQAVLDKKENEIQEKTEIATEKKLVIEKKSAQRVAAAAVALFGDIVQKLKYAKETRAVSKAAVKKANTEARKNMAKTVTENHKKRVLRFLNKKNAAEKLVETTAEAVEEINKKLIQIRKRLLREEEEAEAEAEKPYVLSSDMMATMWGEEPPYLLKDYWFTKIMQSQKLNLKSPFSADNVPTGDQITMQWNKVCACIMNCANKNHAVLVGEGLWNECYDRLFCYEARKKLVENEVFFQKDISGYVKIVEIDIKTANYSYSHYDTVQITEAVLATTCSNCFFWGLKNDEDVEISGFEEFIQLGFNKLPFLPRYKTDEARKTFAAMDAIPYPLETGKKALCMAMPSIYNCWPGFLVEKTPPIPPDEVEALVRPLLYHLLMLFGVQRIVDFVIAWLAQLIQDTANPTGVCIILQGEQGCGKDIFFLWFVHSLLGRPAGFQTAKPHEDIFGKHSVAQKNCVLALFDELEADTTAPLMGPIKNFITSPKHNLNPKHGTLFQVSNFTNIMCTTNSKNPVKIDARERRFVVIGCRETKLNDVEYFSQLGQHLDKPETARAFFQYLRDMVDIEPFKPFQAHRPITNAYVSMQQTNIPLPYQFLSAQVDIAMGKRQTTAVFAAQGFFETFVRWLRDGNHDTRRWNSCVFGKEMTSLETRIDDINSNLVNSNRQKIFRKHRVKNYYEYHINVPELHTFLQKTALYYSQ